MRIASIFALLFIVFSGNSYVFCQINSQLDPFIFSKKYKKLSDSKKIDSVYDLVSKDLKNEHEILLNTIAYCDAIDMKGEHSKALQLLDDSNIEISTTIPSIILAEYYSVLGNISLRNENPQLAVEQYNKSIEFIDESFSNEIIQSLKMRLSNGLNATGKHQEAQEALEEALQLETNGTNRNSLYLRLNSALTKSYLGQDEVAKHYFKDALVIIDMEKDTFAKVRTLGNIADIYAKQDSFELSKKYYLEGMLLAQKFGLSLDLIRFNMSISNLYAANNQFKEAYFFKKASDSISNNYNSTAYSQQIVSIELQHQLEKEQLENQIKNQTIETNRNQQFMLYSFIAILIVILIFISFLLMQLKNKNKVLLENSLPTEDILDDNHSDGEKDVQYEELIHELELALSNKEILFNQNLSIELLTKLLQTNRSYISEAINSHYQMGFSKLINKKRIEEAKKMLIEPKFDHFSIEGIATTVGFSSISSFNSNFKSITGLTPSYLRKNRKK